jgi:hypothetical protein
MVLKQIDEPHAAITDFERDLIRERSGPARPVRFNLEVVSYNCHIPSKTDE